MYFLKIYFFLDNIPMGVYRDGMENIVNRLQRIEGQVRALQTMVQDESDCEKIVTQFKAAQSALDSCFTQLMTDNLQQCITSQDTRKLKSILKILLKQ